MKIFIRSSRTPVIVIGISSRQKYPTKPVLSSRTVEIGWRVTGKRRGRPRKISIVEKWCRHRRSIPEQLPFSGRNPPIRTRLPAGKRKLSNARGCFIIDRSQDLFLLSPDAGYAAQCTRYDSGSHRWKGPGGCSRRAPGSTSGID